MKELKKKPDELDSFEYLTKHLWEWARKGGWVEEFRMLQEVLPYLGRFAGLNELLDYLEQGHARLSNRLGKDLIRLYQEKRWLRQTAMELLLILLWSELTELYESLPRGAYEGEAFSEIYWELFVILEEASARTLDDLINELKKRIS